MADSFACHFWLAEIQHNFSTNTEVYSQIDEEINVSGNNSGDSKSSNTGLKF